MFHSHNKQVAKGSSCVVRAVHQYKRVLGLQAAGRRNRGLQPVPGSSLGECAPLAEADVLLSLRGGLSFYEGLQVS